MHKGVLHCTRARLGSLSITFLPEHNPLNPYYDMFTYGFEVFLCGSSLSYKKVAKEDWGMGDWVVHTQR